MNFEDKLNDLNEWYFFREFTYSKITFQPSPSQKMELADSIMWIGDILIIYQLKEREKQKITTAKHEKRWFDKKVIDKATRQVRDTLKYINDVGVIEIKNRKGHTFRLDINLIHKLHKLIVYLPHVALPEDCQLLKFYRSRTVGIIHLVSANDYLGIIRTLLTPAEVAEYLDFREDLINKWGVDIISLPESALVGQYLNGDINMKPSIEFIEYLRRLDHRVDEWDMSGIISRFMDRIVTNNSTDYYLIIQELALLKRNELREIKKRFQLSIEKTRADVFVLPYRLVTSRTNCGFVFIPLTKDMLIHRTDILQNLTLAHKYEMKLQKCIGVSLADDVEKWVTAEWCYLDFPWERNIEIEDMLQKNYPFREVRQGEIPRYDYKDVE